MSKQKSQPPSESKKPPSYFQVLSPYNYTNRDGEEKTGWTEVGIGFLSKDNKGMNLEIRPGISVSGRIVIRPGKSKNDAEERDIPTSFRHDLTTPLSSMV